MLGGVQVLRNNLKGEGGGTEAKVIKFITIFNWCVGGVQPKYYSVTIFEEGAIVKIV